MSVRLIAEVVRYLRSRTELTPGERLVLMLVAERANEQTREAWQGRADDPDRWALAPLVGVSESRLREILAQLATRGLDVRVSIGKIEQGARAGQPVYATWNRQTTYRLPYLDAGIPAPSEGAQPPDSRRIQAPGISPVGAGFGPRRRRDPRAQAPVLARVDAGIPAPYPSVPSGPSRTVTVPEPDSAATLRAALPGEDQPDDPLPADVAKAQARAALAKYRRAPTSHWTAGTAPVGEPNPHYDPAAAAALAATREEPQWQMPHADDDPAQTPPDDQP